MASCAIGHNHHLRVSGTWHPPPGLPESRARNDGTCTPVFTSGLHTFSQPLRPAAHPWPKQALPTGKGSSKRASLGKSMHWGILPLFYGRCGMKTFHCLCRGILHQGLFQITEEFTCNYSNNSSGKANSLKYFKTSFHCHLKNGWQTFLFSLKLIYYDLTVPQGQRNLIVSYEMIE